MEINLLTSNWLFLTILSVFVVSVANILQRVLMKDDKSNPYSYAIVFHFLIAILNLIFALAIGSEFKFNDLNPAFLLITTLLWGGSTIFLFKALQLLESSEVTILSTIRVPITILASVIFLQESFNLQKIIGTGIILLSTLLVINLKRGLTLNKGIFYVIALAIFSGLAIVADSFNVKHYDAAAYNTLMNFSIGFVLLIFYPKALQQWKQFVEPNFIIKMLPLALFSTIQAVAYLYAFTSGGDTSQVGTIRQSAVIMTVILATIILNERANLVRKILAAILVTFGVVLLS